MWLILSATINNTLLMDMLPQRNSVNRDVPRC